MHRRTGQQLWRRTGVNARVPDAARLSVRDDSAFVAGRSCPLSYRYTPSSLAQLPTTETDTLYCVGGLYGNVFALDALEQLLKTESATTRVVFNGDFHWFDATPDAFKTVENRSTQFARYARLRGNVETEIASDNDIGCGCAYPDAVDDGVVDRSNEILRTLRVASVAQPNAESIRAALAALPMCAAYRVGRQRIIAVHGDLESLAGWRLDPKSLDSPDAQNWVTNAMGQADADIVASSHTCLPALRHFTSKSVTRTIINNGAAGMPCFSDTHFGVVTRIASTPAASVGHIALYGAKHADVWVEALALEFNFDAWRSYFLSMWPAGTAAHQSYFARIENGVNFSPVQALASARDGSVL
jgi:hypothetical protein